MDCLALGLAMGAQQHLWGWLRGHSRTRGWAGIGAGYGVTAAPIDGLALGTQQHPWMTWHWGYGGTAAPMDGLALGLPMGSQQDLWMTWQWGWL